jgi:hypothetical protein
VRPTRSSRASFRFAALALGGLALLFWLKLRLVTGVPRTAYADPDELERAKSASLSPNAPTKSPRPAPLNP